jgi:hypothetical protein
MKKFIISFNYEGFPFTGKVSVNKVANSIVYTVVVTESANDSVIANKPLIFLRDDRGYQLAILDPNKYVEIIPWRIKMEYVDKSRVAIAETFSLS